MDGVSEAISRLPAISFLWPRMLWLLALIPLLALAYLWLDARRQRTAVHYPALKTVGFANRSVAGWRRHVSPVLILLALTALIVAISRPHALMVLPSRIETVMLIIDLSGSMRAKDVQPNRLRAAQHAAKGLLEAKPAGVSVGLVAMAGTSAVAQAPSRRKQDVATAIDRLQPQGGTALGNGLLIALTALRPQATEDAARLMEGDASPLKKRGPPGTPFGAPGPAQAGPQAGAQGAANSADPEAPAGPGSYAAGAIVVFSDGESNAGPTAVQAAELAATYGVRVFTVGVGTTQGVVLSADGWSARVKLDEAVLKEVANITGAEYFRLEDAARLKQVYRAINAKLTLGKTEQAEITALFAALGAVLAAGAALLSLWWFGRVM
ncbi:von Willebrand factor A [Cupriavidus sp. HPC(L)]|uniref:vWA domain-containing protein n=1 Tax=Cupriavidus sp. HPC(L) TaxID=1217418 RepID=UPI0002918D05|nr:VWA domain-containing protein [Cupriavidus sp. HPC(L)]ESJ12534.1 von Willebrand factor A [Cupriavidus sp. HPC(L)]